MYEASGLRLEVSLLLDALPSFEMTLRDATHGQAQVTRGEDPSVG